MYVCLKVSENIFWVIFVSKRFDAGKMLFILAIWFRQMFHQWLTELNSQRDALESVRIVYLQEKSVESLPGATLVGFFFWAVVVRVFYKYRKWSIRRRYSNKRRSRISAAPLPKII